MFFPEKIKSIKPDDYVLEIGPGSAPHPRSNILLEKVFDDDKIAKGQRGRTPKLNTSKKVVFYHGDIFPFQDNEFDYVICSHVLEHIIDLKGFLKEVFRIANRGYIEYPLIYYDYIYNIPEHVTFLKFNKDKLFFFPKSMTSLSEFSEINEFFFESLNAGHTCLIDNLKHDLFEGFEWNAPFKIEKAEQISDVCWEYKKLKSPEIRIIKKSTNLIVSINKIINRFF